MFETFWQGRLIPGSGVESLPFIEALRTKMRGSSSGKDYLPDEVFGRIRCAPFSGAHNELCAPCYKHAASLMCMRK
jgi:hypothetical protein